jgi:hypothetical protein
MSLPAVAVTRDAKRVLVAWKQVNKDAPHVSWREATGTARDADLQIQPGGAQDHPCLAFAPHGGWAAVWEETRNGQQSIWYRTSQPRDQGRQLSGSNKGQAAFPMLVIGGKNTIVAYETKEGERLSVVVLRL